jgi:hypothetical protein
MNFSTKTLFGRKKRCSFASVVLYGLHHAQPHRMGGFATLLSAMDAHPLSSITAVRLVRSAGEVELQFLVRDLAPSFHYRIDTYVAHDDIEKSSLHVKSDSNLYSLQHVSPARGKCVVRAVVHHEHPLLDTPLWWLQQASWSQSRI